MVADGWVVAASGMTAGADGWTEGTDGGGTVGTVAAVGARRDARSSSMRRARDSGTISTVGWEFVPGVLQLWTRRGIRGFSKSWPEFLIKAVRASTSMTMCSYARNGISSIKGIGSCSLTLALITFDLQDPLLCIITNSTNSKLLRGVPDSDERLSSLLSGFP